jgi:AAA+ superfamily predicted ATPase
VAVAAKRFGVVDAARSSEPLAGLAPALARLDERLRAAVDAAATAYGPEAAADPHRGLYVGDDEVARLLARAPGLPLLGPAGDEPRLAAAAGGDSALAGLGRAFALEPLDLDVVLVALAPELDLRYERLYAYLQDDVTRRRPSVDLVLNLLCADAAAKLAARARLAPDAPLLRHRLVELVADPAQPQQALLAQPLKLDDQVVRALLGERGLDARLAACARLVIEPRGSLAGLPGERMRSLVALARTARAEGAPLRLSFEGRPGAGRSSAAEALAAELGMPLLAADLARALEPAADAAAKLALLVRETRLQDAVLFLGDLDALRAPDHNAGLELLLRELDAHAGIVILAGASSFAPTRTAGRRPLAGLVTVPFPLPDAAARRACWTSRLDEAGVATSAETIDALGGRFRLTPGQIADAVAAAGDRATQLAAESGDDAAPGAHELFAAARAQSGDGLAALARKVTPRRRFEDIVLPPDRLEQLLDVCNTVRHRSTVYDDWGFDDRLSLGKGLNVLFAGPSGTGKTLAAEILACELGLELYKIDLSAVVSKYVGETEKNLARIFAEAETASAILFFDEADALFGKRSEVKDAHDRYANIEIGYLLQKMEEYDGTVVLATNLRRNMDEAFVRRMHFTIEFPLPDEEDRLRIWRAMWPAATPLDPELDLAMLARRFELSGGHIRNIAVAAAFLAAADGRVVTMEHLLRATRREYQKLGQVVLETSAEGPE